jgi:hypothetical protein
MLFSGLNTKGVLIISVKSISQSLNSKKSEEEAGFTEEEGEGYMKDKDVKVVFDYIQRKEAILNGVDPENMVEVQQSVAKGLELLGESFGEVKERWVNVVSAEKVE